MSKFPVTGLRDLLRCGFCQVMQDVAQLNVIGPLQAERNPHINYSRRT